MSLAYDIDLMHDVYMTGAQREAYVRIAQAAWRYEFLRFNRMADTRTGEELDAAIDAAMVSDDPRYTLTDLGNAYRTAMQSGAKLNGEVKAGEDKDG